MWIAYPPRVDSAGDAVADLPALAQALLEDLKQYAARAEPSWLPDALTVSTPRAGVEVVYIDRYGVVCPIALFLVCPPEEGPDGPERLWWLRAIPYLVREGDSAYRMLVASAAGWLGGGAHGVDS